MFFHKTHFTPSLLIFSLSIMHASFASGFPTAKQIFEDRSDPMLVTLTHLSYLQYDEDNNF